MHTLDYNLPPSVSKAAARVRMRMWKRCWAVDSCNRYRPLKQIFKKWYHPISGITVITSLSCCPNLFKALPGYLSALKCKMSEKQNRKKTHLVGLHVITPRASIFFFLCSQHLYHSSFHLTATISIPTFSQCLFKMPPLPPHVIHPILISLYKPFNTKLLEHDSAFTDLR